MTAQRPLIIAFCGASAVGKDTLANALYEYLAKNNIKVYKPVSDTTRPARPGEINGVNYNFYSKEEFNIHRRSNDYIEWTIFRDWFYGTSKDEIKTDAANICVLNKHGIENLIFSHDYQVIPIFLTLGWRERLKRSINREGQFKWEYIRRLFADWKDFRKFKQYLKNNFQTYIILNCNKYKSIDSQISEIIQPLGRVLVKYQ